MIGRPRPDVPIVAGEKVLAWATGVGGDVVAGTRDALYVAGARVPWERVQAADWDADTSVLRVQEVGTWGDIRPEHVLSLEAPGRLLQLVRERVTATVLVQRHVPVYGRRGLRVIARRAPGGARQVTWIYEYDAGIDPHDPDVRAAAEAALAQARDEVGIDG